MRVTPEFMRHIGELGRIPSIEAMHEKRRKNIEEYNKNPKLCRMCNTPIDYDNKRNNFCSKSCSAKHNNVGKRRHGRAPRYCQDCGKKLSSTVANKCFKCNANIRFDNKIKRIEQKMIGSYESYIEGDDIKIYLIYTRGKTCEKCRNTHWNGDDIPLTSHHIDGNYLNNNPSNLELICPNCHAQTDTYAGKNKHASKRYRYARARDKGL